MKTKCTVLGATNREETELRPIKLEGCLMNTCKDTNYSQFGSNFLDPNIYRELKLVPVIGYDKDIIIAVCHNGDEVIMFGEWNDGVVK